MRAGAQSPRALAGADVRLVDRGDLVGAGGVVLRVLQLEPGEGLDLVRELDGVVLAQHPRGLGLSLNVEHAQPHQQPRVKGGEDLRRLYLGKRDAQLQQGCRLLRPVLAVSRQFDFFQKVGELVPAGKDLLLLVALHLPMDELLEIDVVSVKGLVEVHVDELVDRRCFLELTEGESAEYDVVSHLVGEGADVLLVLDQAGLVDFLGLAQLVGFLLDGQQELRNGCFERGLIGAADGFEDVVIAEFEDPA